MTDIKDYFLQEKEIGDEVFNSDTTNIYSTSRSINGDVHKDRPDRETYIFNNNLQTKLYYKEDGIVSPIRHKPKLHLNKEDGYGVFIIKYFTIYQESFDSIPDIINYNVLHNKDKNEDILNTVNSILNTSNKPLVQSIRLRFITFVPESTILLNKAINVGNIILLKDIDRSYNNGIVTKQQYSTNKLDCSLHVEVQYNSHSDKQMYYKIGKDFIKIKTCKQSSPYESISAYSFIDGTLIDIKCYPVNGDTRNIFGVYTKEETEQTEEEEASKHEHLLQDMYDNAFKKREIINDIKKVIVNDEQAKLEVQKAIFKLTKEVNDNELKKSVQDYKDMIKGNKADTTLVSDMLKIFKAII